MMLAIVNRAAGGGRCGRQADEALARLRAAGTAFEVRETAAPGDAGRIAVEACLAGQRELIAVGGDGTIHEIVNGVMHAGERISLGFLPLGTGNSFLRDFDDNFTPLVERRRRACDVLRLRHDDGEIYSVNLISVGFAADVATVTNRRFKSLGSAGYALGVLSCLARLRRRAFPLRADGGDLEDNRCLFLAFSNSKHTGGAMRIAPDADTASGRIEFVRFGPIGRLGLLRRFPRIYRGTHVQPPWGTRSAVERIDFEIEEPVDLMIDGEVVTLRPLALEVLPGALEVFL